MYVGSIDRKGASICDLVRNMRGGSLGPQTNPDKRSAVAINFEKSFETASIVRNASSAEKRGTSMLGAEHAEP